MDTRKIIVGLIAVAIVLSVFWFFGWQGLVGGVQSLVSSQDERGAAQVSPKVGEIVTIVPNASLGEYLGDAFGMALYTTTKEACDSACLSVWPPYEAVGKAEGGNGRLGVRMNDEAGVLQYTWDGKFLYYYKGDEKVGDVNGHEFGDAWSLVQG